MTNIVNKILFLIVLLTTSLLMGCQQEPQKARHISEKPEVDSAIIAQLQFNTHMADAADKICKEYVKADSTHQYALDDFGSWYTKTITNNADSVHEGQEVSIHLQVSEINGQLISDIKTTTHIGTGDLPISITRALKMMHIGEQMHIIAPWYAAYGVEGTKIIKPYSNLSIIITIEQ